MKKLSPFKLLLIAPSIILTSCGYGLKEIYNGVPYNSSNFFDNYYSVWNDSINPYKDGNKITETYDEKELDDKENVVFTSAVDNANFQFNELESDKYVYFYDIVEPEADSEYAGKVAYGPAVKLSNYDDSFRYGVIGKLFDGQMFCNGYYANARVQVKPGRGNGFGALFSKESNDATYMMMNFKCSSVTKSSQNLSRGESEIKLIISLLYKNETGYTRLPVTYTLSGVPTNSGDDAYGKVKRSELYTCFGFSLPKNDRLIGFSFEYEKISDTVDGKGEETHHAVMLYEVSFPHTTWH